MKRMICAALCGALALGTLWLAGCSGEQERSRYAMTLEYFPETRTLEGEMTADIVNTSDTARETLLFQLWANAYREGAEYRPVSDLFAPAAYYDGASYGGIVVSDVAGAAGFRVAGEDENILEVSLREPLYPDERVSLSMTITASGSGKTPSRSRDFIPFCAHATGRRSTSMQVSAIPL